MPVAQPDGAAVPVGADHLIPALGEGAALPTVRFGGRVPGAAHDHHVVILIPVGIAEPQGALGAAPVVGTGHPPRGVIEHLAAKAEWIRHGTRTHTAGCTIPPTRAHRTPGYGTA